MIVCNLTVEAQIGVEFPTPSPIVPDLKFHVVIKGVNPTPLHPFSTPSMWCKLQFGLGTHIAASVVANDTPGVPLAVLA